MTTNTSASQSGIFNPRTMVAFALCSCGVVLGMFSLAATPPAQTTRANTSLPADPLLSQNFPSRSGTNLNRLPAGVPLPPGAVSNWVDPLGDPFSVYQHGNPLSSGPAATFPRVPLSPGAGRDWIKPLANQSFGNPQPSFLTSQPTAPGDSMLLDSAAAATWSIVPSPNASNVPPRDFKALACTSPSDCWAVGDYLRGYVRQALIEHWDGTSWAIVNSPNLPNDTLLSTLQGVTCVSGSDCWAVGTYANNAGVEQSLIEHWDGTSWTIVASPAATTKWLQGVTCVTGSDCWAVGYYYNENDLGFETLVEHWNGTSWAIVDSPNSILGMTPAQTFNDLYSVTCTSRSDCWAVGSYYTEGVGFETLIEHWDGTSWSIVSAPTLLNPAQQNGLYGVACTSRSDCWAVGFYLPVPQTAVVSQTLIVHWDGVSWSIVTSPNTSLTQVNYLRAVTCVSGSDCWATGQYVANTRGQTLMEHWNGTSWSIVTSPNPRAGNANSSLYGVACTSTSDCWTAGFDLIGYTFEPLVEHWNGSSWSIATSDNSPVKVPNYLYGVACTSTSDCWAAGYRGDFTYQTLLEHWDGSSWSVVNSPNSSDTESNSLQSLTCVSASECWAVGYHSTDTGSQTLIVHLNGAAWVIAPNTDGPGTINILNGVTCASASDCWAVGYSYNGSVYQTLIKHWDGTSWSAVSSPNTSLAQINYLQAVTCVSGSDCWVAGYSNNGIAAQTLIEHWDGTSWSIVSSPNTSLAQINYLQAVTCVSGSDCWAVGYSQSDSGGFQTLIARWGGTSWAIVSSPNTNATQNNVLNGVTCASASDCSAVGSYDDNAGNFYTLIEHWDGTSWAIISSPNTSLTQPNILNGVACTSASDCWAVGYFAADGTVKTLIEHYTASPPIPTSVVSRKTHGTAGDFDINLPLTGTPGIECRSGGANGDYTMVFTFANPLTSVGGASVTSGTGSIRNSAINSSDAHQYIVNLTGVNNAQVITVSLTNVNDAVGNFSSAISASMGVLVGDTNANGLVNSSDISQTKAQSGQVATTSNFRTDVNVNGLINSSDISLVKSKSGTALP